MANALNIACKGEMLIGDEAKDLIAKIPLNPLATPEMIKALKHEKEPLDCVFTVEYRKGGNGTYADSAFESIANKILTSPVFVPACYGHQSQEAFYYEGREIYGSVIGVLLDKENEKIHYRIIPDKGDHAEKIRRWLKNKQINAVSIWGIPTYDSTGAIVIDYNLRSIDFVPPFTEGQKNSVHVGEMDISYSELHDKLRIALNEKYKNYVYSEEVDTKDIKGAAAFKEMQGDIKALVYVGKKADFSTFVHEAAHVARKTLNGDLLIKAEEAFNVKEGKWTRAQEEEFAQGFEQYLKEGIAPAEELKSIFQKAAEFLSRIYKNLKEIIGINDDIRKVYDELLGKDNSTLKQAENKINETERLKQSKKNTTGKYPSVEDYENNKISETEEDKALDDTALKEKYKAYAKEHFQGNTYHNADTNLDIRVSRDIIGEWKAKTKSREQIISMQLLDKMIETAVETNATKDKYNKEYTTSIKYFETGLTVNDKTYKAHLTVKEIQETDNKAYHYYLEDVSFEDILVDQIKKEAALSPLGPLNERGNQPLLHGSDNSITQNTEAVNTAHCLTLNLTEKKAVHHVKI